MARLLSTGEIVDRAQRQPPAPLRLAFRPFFLLGALFSVISLLLWVALFSGQLQLAVYGGPLWWHLHEMLFGFVTAIIVGFLLTAVRTWTGQPGLEGRPLAALVGLWLAGRLLLLFPLSLPPWLIALVDLAFLPLAALILFLPVARVRQWRNSIFLPLLLAMAAINGVMHWAANAGDPGLQSRAATAMVMLVTLLMTIMAGRVVPMFTANGTGTPRVEALGWLETLSLGSMLATAVVSLPWPGMPPAAVALCCFVAALAHALRGLRWRIWVTVRTPLVWSLHLSYLCIPLGLLLYGLSAVSSLVSPSQAIHTLTVGAMGLLILAMISRVSLGHTGRPLQAGRVMTLAFALLFAAFLVRVFGSYWLSSYTLVINSAAVLWALGFGCFVIRYWPVLTRPRVDGRPG
ncbi:NnrS family protein [Seongchinamella sediminis]|uniref:NnrS family protein n=1 Tax=Seongchinamella sediminis TaxID=2283635 RepID=A0A3L7DVR5_9GAMM|nr:NnrS family protein [Seongchinamella sediminis]RLQ20690.1 NnrS family protein [Seongchinamella sediminis]